MRKLPMLVFRNFRQDEIQLCSSTMDRLWAYNNTTVKASTQYRDAVGLQQHNITMEAQYKDAVGIHHTIVEAPCMQFNIETLWDNNNNGGAATATIFIQGTLWGIGMTPHHL